MNYSIYRAFGLRLSWLQSNDHANKVATLCCSVLQCVAVCCNNTKESSMRAGKRYKFSNITRHILKYHTTHAQTSHNTFSNITPHNPKHHTTICKHHTTHSRASARSHIRYVKERMNWFLRMCNSATKATKRQWQLGNHRRKKTGAACAAERACSH